MKHGHIYIQLLNVRPRKPMPPGPYFPGSGPVAIDTCGIAAGMNPIKLSRRCSHDHQEGLKGKGAYLQMLQVLLAYSKMECSRSNGGEIDSPQPGAGLYWAGSGHNKAVNCI